MNIHPDSNTLTLLVTECGPRILPKLVYTSPSLIGPQLRGVKVHCPFPPLAMFPVFQKKSQTPVSRVQKNYIQHIELPAKLPDYFSRSNKSNINQYVVCCLSLLYMCGLGLHTFSVLICDLLLKGGRGLSSECALPEE